MDGIGNIQLKVIAVANTPRGRSASAPSPGMSPVLRALHVRARALHRSLRSVSACASVSPPSNPTRDTRAHLSTTRRVYDTHARIPRSVPVHRTPRLPHAHGPCGHVQRARARAHADP